MKPHPAYAEGHSTRRAAEICGHKESWGRNILAAMKRELGVEQCR